MKVRINRDSVCAGDDVDSHDRTLELVAVETFDALVARVVAEYALPKIEGGRATWCLASRWPIAIVAQEWLAPRVLPQIRSVADCAAADGALELHFTYLAQIDPEAALEVLRRVRFMSS